MIKPEEWIQDILRHLKEAFGTRLRYLGLQGSYRRGEATEKSDIDLVVFLDTLDLDDLDLYRDIVRSMPEGDKACGFVSGIEAFANWPRHELFSFKMDTRDYYGKLDDFLPPIEREDVQRGVKIASSTLVHLLTHSYLFADAPTRPAILQEALKSAYFLMQLSNYLATGNYPRSKKELLSCVEGVEREILEAGLDFSAWLTSHSEKEAFGMLLDWSRGLLVHG